MTLRWSPRLQPKDVAVNPGPRPIGGPPALDGGAQWVQSDAGCWYIDYYGISVVESDRIKLFRILQGLLNGPATSILVPTFDCKQAPWPLDGSGRKIIGSYTPHSDGTPFSDDTLYYNQSIDITCAVASAGLSALTITVNMAGELQGGEHFSVGERLYRIIGIEQVSSSPLMYDVDIWPPLREAIADGAQLDFDRPVCRCILADPRGLMLTLQSRVIGRPNVSFIEAFP